MKTKIEKLKVGDRFLHDGHRYTVADFGGPPGELIDTRSKDGFARTFLSGSVVYKIAEDTSKQEHKAVLKAANEMLDHLSTVDWRYESGFGQVFTQISARKLLEWCDILGGDPPEGTEEHAKNGC